jgi:hypothetical protein
MAFKATATHEFNLKLLSLGKELKDFLSCLKKSVLNLNDTGPKIWSYWPEVPKILILQFLHCFFLFPRVLLHSNTAQEHGFCTFPASGGCFFVFLSYCLATVCQTL